MQLTCSTCNVHQMRGRYSIYTYPSSHTMSILYPSVLYKYHRLRSPQSTCYSTTVFIYFPPSAATPRDTRPDSCKMHPTCPVCSAAMDGPGKTCPSCGAVRYLFLDLFFRFSLPRSLHRSGGDCDEGGKRGSVFFNFKGEDDPNECKKKLCTLRSHFFYLSSSFSILARVVPGSCTCVRSSAE